MKKNIFGPQGWTPERLGSLKGKTFLITGANSGTGFEASKILLSKGAHVVMLNRNAEKTAGAISLLEPTLNNGSKITFIQLDLSDLSSVRNASDKILSELSRIDALICNGAIAQVPKQVLTADGFESQLATNHYGHFLLQGLLFPLIEQSGGRIVTVGSMGYNLGIKTIQFEDINWDNNYHANNVYSQSKLAQIMSVYELQRKLKKTGKTNVKVYACHPGASSTSLIKTSGSLLMRSVWFLMTLSPFVQSAEKGAYPELMCATEPELDQDGFYGPTGRGYWTGPVGECILEPHAKDRTVAQKLWQVSEQATGFQWKL